MRHIILLVGILIILASCKTSKNLVVDSTTGLPVPQITWLNNNQDLGQVKRGETRDLIFNFRNTGSADLEIELVTACKCTTLDWPRLPIPPGQSGAINVTYDSKDQKLGAITKTVDIIGNMDPIVSEAFFEVEVVE